VKIQSVQFNNRKKAFEVRIRNRVFVYPYARMERAPRAGDQVREAFVDPELGREGFSYVLESGREGAIHAEQVLDYNEDPDYLRQALLYQLTVEAQKRIEESPLSKREIIRRLGTSATQFYRLLDQTNTRKSIGQLLSLLHILDCHVELVVKKRKSA
jgi:predicted XRE-type DNA-binding protein